MWQSQNPISVNSDSSSDNEIYIIHPIVANLQRLATLRLSGWWLKINAREFISTLLAFIGYLRFYLLCLPKRVRLSESAPKADIKNANPAPEIVEVSEPV